MANQKGYLIEIIDWATDMISVSTPVLNVLGIPVTPQSTIIIGKTLKLLLQMGLPMVLKDLQSRPLTPLQKERVEEVDEIAIRTIYDLIEKNEWEDSHPESALYTQNCVEYIEDIYSKAINESRRAKRLLLGTYLGSTLYALNTSKPSWDNVFYLSSIIKSLTMRQIVLLKLIVEQFDGVDDNEEDLICITNKVAISEIKDIESRSLWVGIVRSMPDPTYLAIPLKYMSPTDLTKELVGIMHFSDELQEYKNEIISSLDLKPYSQTELFAYYAKQGETGHFIKIILEKLRKNKEENS